MSKLKKSYMLKKLDITYDNYGQQKKAYTDLREIEVIVVIKKNKALGLDGTEYTLVENLGLTTDKQVEKGMRLVSLEDGTTYTVEFVNNIARLAQLELKEVR